jgi:hypothetical protein
MNDEFVRMWKEGTRLEDIVCQPRFDPPTLRIHIKYDSDLSKEISNAEPKRTVK